MFFSTSTSSTSCFSYASSDHVLLKLVLSFHTQDTGVRLLLSTLLTLLLVTWLILLLFLLRHHHHLIVIIYYHMQSLSLCTFIYVILVNFYLDVLLLNLVLMTLLTLKAGQTFAKVVQYF